MFSLISNQKKRGWPLGLPQYLNFILSLCRTYEIWSNDGKKLFAMSSPSFSTKPVAQVKRGRTQSSPRHAEINFFPLFFFTREGETDSSLIKSRNFFIRNPLPWKKERKKENTLKIIYAKVKIAKLLWITFIQEIINSL